MEKIVLNKYGYYSVENVPTEKELAEYYANKYYQGANGSYEVEYDEEEVKYFKNKISERAYIIEKNLTSKNSKRFLDIGCGEGWALSYFKDKGWDILGLDYSSFGCEKFNSNCAKNLIIGNIYQNLNTLINQEKKYSVIWIDNVLEHVTDPEFLVKEIKKILEVDGILVIEVPNDFSFIQEYVINNKIVEKQYWVATPDHLSYFNKNGLNNLLLANGYKDLELISDYAIDVNLLNSHTNYISDKQKGKACHKERIIFDNLLHEKSIEDVVAYYKASAQLGLGRQITGFYKLS
jgi:2-polyprenyl-3-methyl-5-hydroxy-6-metoxy-1,4-benzoquinol methylase